MPNIGVPGLIIILVIALIIFGPSKLPQLGKAVGQTLKEFKNSTKDIVDDVTDEFKMDETETTDKEKSITNYINPYLITIIVIGYGFFYVRWLLSLGDRVSGLRKLANEGSELMIKITEFIMYISHISLLMEF